MNAEVVSVLVPKVLAKTKSAAKRILKQAGFTSRFGLVETANNFRAPQSDQLMEADSFETGRKAEGVRPIRALLD